jgi:hypothetical protein
MRSQSKAAISHLSGQSKIFIHPLQRHDAASIMALIIQQAVCRENKYKNHARRRSRKEFPISVSPTNRGGAIKCKFNTGPRPAQFGQHAHRHGVRANLVGSACRSRPAPRDSGPANKQCARGPDFNDRPPRCGPCKIIAAHLSSRLIRGCARGD